MDLFKEKVFLSEKTGKSLKYLYYSPECEENVPLIIHLHGAGSRGPELSQMAHTGPIGELEKGRNIPARIVSPQCWGNTWFELFETLIDFTETAVNADGVDKSRVYLTGLSMGAYAAWQLAMTRPLLFAALVAVCGGGMYWNAARLKNMPVWAFHGARDSTVLPEESIKMIRQINKNDGHAKITIFENADHNSWDQAFTMDELWEWLMKQKKEPEK